MRMNWQWFGIVCLSASKNTKKKFETENSQKQFDKRYVSCFVDLQTFFNDLIWQEIPILIQMMEIQQHNHQQTTRKISLLLKQTNNFDCQITSEIVNLRNRVTLSIITYDFRAIDIFSFNVQSFIFYLRNFLFFCRFSL